MHIPLWYKSKLHISLYSLLALSFFVSLFYVWPSHLSGASEYDWNAWEPPRQATVTPFTGPKTPPPKPKPKVKPKPTNGLTPAMLCSCVLGAKYFTGYNKPVGNAKNWPVNSQIPSIGGVVVLNGKGTGHVAVITDVTPTTIKVKQTNSPRCAYSVAELSRTDARILGFWTNS